MRHPIKLWIKKKIIHNEHWKRFEPCCWLLLDDNSAIQTEAQLCYYIYRRFGEGRYMCLAFQRGHEGFWLFFLGNLYDNGFIRDLRKNKELNKAKTELMKANQQGISYEERQLLEEDIDLEREISKEEKGTKKSGPIGLIKSRPGTMHPYQEF